ncbi:hypothetical protein CRE_14342 [Caenorhabditis remanei]|uniref:F-box domain-containing protein n=1 Tax=Caenorhabditis remanei TaxID=31234 RepID=E3NIP0_CAERE|nr:hypothetical protein CRE_14342 [Caenorhabditis remanei]
MTYFYWEFPTDLSIDRRALVLYDISQWKTVEKSYESFEKLCITLGIENISFSDFEWCVKLRKVSQGLRIVVDRIKPPITEIEVKCMANDVFVCFNKESLMSTDSPWKRLLALSIIHNKKYVRIDSADLVNALSHRKLRLNFFRFQTDFHYSQVNYFWTRENPWHIYWTRDENQPYFLDVFQGLNILIHVKHCSIGVLKEEYILEILRILRPGSLEKLTIEPDLGLPLIDQRADILYRQSIFEKVVKVDQWKEAKHVEIRKMLPLPIENFFHLTTFETHLSSISVKIFTKMIDAFSKSSNFEYCVIITEETVNFGSIKRELNLQDADDWGIHHIPNTNFFVEIFDHLHGFKLIKNVEPLIMLDPPSLSPIELHSLILYNIHQWKTAEKSYENYKKVCRWPVEKNMLSAEDFEYLVDQYSKEYYYLSRNGRNLPKYCSEICIHSDFVEGISKKDSYEKIKDALGENMMYRDVFEYFYDKFELKAASKHLKFSDLPFDVIRIVVEYGDLKSKLTLRKVSRDLRMIVDQQKPAFKSISIENENYESIYVVFNDRSIVYTNNQYHPMKYKTKVIVNYHFEEIAFDDFAFAFRNPALQLSSLLIRLTDLEYEQRLIDILNSLNHQIHVEYCLIEFGNEEYVINILKCLEPKTLNKLTVCYAPSDSNDGDEISFMSLEEVSTMDLWKQVKHVKILDIPIISIDPFLHLTTFEVEVESISMEDLLKLRDQAASESTNFVSCTINSEQFVIDEFIAISLQLESISDKFCIVDMYGRMKSEFCDAMEFSRLVLFFQILFIIVFIRNNSYKDSLRKTRRNTIHAYIVFISAMILSEWTFHREMSVAGGNYYESAVNWGTFFSCISSIIGGKIVALVSNLILDWFSVDIEFGNCGKCKRRSMIRRYDGNWRLFCDQCRDY